MVSTTKSVTCRVAAIFCAMASAALFLACTGGPPHRVVLEWDDEATGLKARIWTRSTMVKWIVELQIWDGSVSRTISLDDGIRLAHVGLVEYGDWLLVVNNQYVIGGYNKETRAMVGENEWHTLPFTVRTHAGRVVKEKVVAATLDPDVPMGLAYVLDRDVLPWPKPKGSGAIGNLNGCTPPPAHRQPVAPQGLQK